MFQIIKQISTLDKDNMSKYRMWEINVPLILTSGATFGTTATATKFLQ